jgi:hypothetical protein
LKDEVEPWIKRLLPLLFNVLDTNKNNWEAKKYSAIAIEGILSSVPLEDQEKGEFVSRFLKHVLALLQDIKQVEVK